MPPNVFPAALAAAFVMASPLAMAGNKPSHAARAHEHGAAELNVSLSGSALTLSLESPADNLLGFEQAPRDARQRATLDAVLTRLRDGAALFTLPTEAQCQPLDAQVRSPFEAVTAPPSQPAEADTHSDIEAEWHFTCQRPQALQQLDAQGLFKAFSRLHRLQTQWALPQGQGAARLTPAKPRAVFGQRP
jgi:hypothetical protein